MGRGERVRVSERATDSPEEPPTRRYDLVVREGANTGLVWRYRDEGVRLTATGLEWTADGTDRVKPFADIYSIRLQTGHIPRSGGFGACQIAFRNGLTLNVNSLSSWGTPDDDRRTPYIDFVHDLHQRLSAVDRKRIHFLAGVTEGRQMMAWIAVVVGGLFFVALPLVLLIVTGETKALFITLAGAFFIYPVLRATKKNEPRNYLPDRVDEDLFP